MAVSTTILRKSMPTFDIESGATAVIVEKIAWDDIEARYVELFGAAFITSAGFTFSHQAAHPDWDWFLAKSVSLEPLFESGPPRDGSAGYPDGARLTITYTAPCLNSFAWPTSQNPEDGTYLSHQVQAGAEMMLLRGHKIVWDAEGEAQNNKPVPEDIDGEIVVPTKVHSLEWSNVTRPPTALLDELLGSTNEEEYMGGDPETLMLESWTMATKYTPEAESLYTVSLAIIEKRIIADDGTGTDTDGVYGWNHRYNAETTPSWQKVKLYSDARPDDQYPPYRIKDWADLLNQEPE